MYGYFAYGLGIRSAVPLPDLEERDSPADVVMQFGKVEPFQGIPADALISLQLLENRAFFFHRGMGSGEAVGGREIIGDPHEGMDLNLMSFLAQGPGLSVLLHQRGYITLHASCVKVGNLAVAFVGDSGSGKSTTAAAMYVRGHALISEEVTVIDNSGPAPAAYPGHPGLRLLPEGVHHLPGPLGEPIQVDTEDRKGKYLAHQGFPRYATPLQRVYVLSEGACTEIKELNGHRAVYELIKHSYWIRLMHGFRPSSYFLQCAKLCSQIPVRQLIREKNGSSLPRIAELVERDVQLCR